jgi:hypothetical protein
MIPPRAPVPVKDALLLDAHGAIVMRRLGARQTESIHMSFIDALPAEVATLLRTQSVSQYATVSGAGVPIDTPTYVFGNADFSTLDVATGLAYPVKAERARRNPKVGLLFEGGPNAPVISVAGMAAVKDADLQANLDRYLSETILSSPCCDTEWSVARQAIWYLTRIIVAITPAHIRWWATPAAMDQAPQEWRAPANTKYPPSDPAPPGKGSAAPEWPAAPWQALAESAFARQATGHLTLLDENGFPVPLPAHDLQRTDDGFRMRVAASAPWRGGKGNLTFWGVESFVGDATRDGNTITLRVERALPVLPLVTAPDAVMNTEPVARAKLMQRLEHEASRRGQPIPKTPLEPPAPTAGARLRAEAAVATQVNVL